MSSKKMQLWIFFIPTGPIYGAFDFINLPKGAFLAVIHVSHGRNAKVSSDVPPYGCTTSSTDYHFVFHGLLLLGSGFGLRHSTESEMSFNTPLPPPGGLFESSAS